MHWQKLWTLAVALTLGTLSAAADDGRPGWPYRALSKPAIPAVRPTAVTNPIDAFVLARLQARGLTLNDRASRLTLLRRVAVDLTGLPPTPAEQEAFLADDRPDAYERLVDRLLASPRYGERWAQHWLDLVRYAESDGFKADDHRPLAHQYRDYVIHAFNDDVPFDRFVRQQLAGDELEPDNPAALIATGFNRLWPDEYNAANLEQRRQEILDDMTDVTGAVFLGLTVGCARCHDHKFDPLTQADYYRLQAFFASMRPRDDLVLADAPRREQHRQQLAAWEQSTAAVRAEMDGLVQQKRQELRDGALQKFRAEIQQAVRAAPAQRTLYQEQIARMAESQLRRAEKDAPAKLAEPVKKQYQALEQQLAALGPRPADLPTAMALTDLGRSAPPTHRLAGGDWHKPKEEVQPGFPEVLGPAVPDVTLPTGVESTGRRAALARWLTDGKNPLTARVLVNRVWQHHFGRGLVATPSDFGAQGDAPTHPELLDWLAADFVERGWGLKALHRLMVTSATYCQTSLVDAARPGHARAAEADPENKLLWHARRRRLEGEAVRDTLLLLGGDLNLRMGGPSARPALPEGLDARAWQADARREDRDRRSVYVLAKRNLRFPFFEAFDQPDLHNSCPRRTQTTTAPQALLLLNGGFTLEQAQRFAARLPHEPRRLVAEAYRAAYGRAATDGELALGVRFLEQQTAALAAAGGADAGQGAAADFCHALLNANEFLYVD